MCYYLGPGYHGAGKRHDLIPLILGVLKIPLHNILFLGEAESIAHGSCRCIAIHYQAMTYPRFPLSPSDLVQFDVRLLQDPRQRRPDDHSPLLLPSLVARPTERGTLPIPTDPLCFSKPSQSPRSGPPPNAIDVSYQQEKPWPFSKTQATPKPQCHTHGRPQPSWLHPPRRSTGMISPGDGRDRDGDAPPPYTGSGQRRDGNGRGLPPGARNETNSPGTPDACGHAAGDTG